MAPKFNELWYTNGLKLDQSFYAHFVSSVFCTLHCQAVIFSLMKTRIESEIINVTELKL